MRILWLKSDLLLPLDKGGKLRTWHLMRHLARSHDITYLSFREPEQPAANIAGMREVASHVETVTRSEAPKGSLAAAWAKFFFSPNITVSLGLTAALSFMAARAYAPDIYRAKSPAGKVLRK